MIVQGGRNETATTWTPATMTKRRRRRRRHFVTKESAIVSEIRVIGKDFSGANIRHWKSLHYS